QSPRLNSTPSASPRSRVSLCLHAFPTRRSSDLNLGRYRPQHPGLDRRYPCDRREPAGHRGLCVRGARGGHSWDRGPPRAGGTALDRKSTRLNSSHASISYAVSCLKNKKSSVPGSHPPRSTTRNSSADSSAPSCSSAHSAFFESWSKVLSYSAQVLPPLKSAPWSLS